MGDDLCPAGQPVDEGGLADVRPAHDGDDHGPWVGSALAEVVLDDRQCSGQDRIFGEPGRVDDVRTLARRERVRASVQLVPTGDLAAPLALSAPRPFSPGRGEEDLDVRLGEHHRADVATLHDGAVGSKRALLRAQDLADRRVGRDLRHDGLDLRGPELLGGLRPVDRQLATLAEREPKLAGKAGETVCVRRVDPPLERQEGNGPVHDPGVHVWEVERLRERQRQGALPGPGRTVDRNDRPHGRTASHILRR